MTQETKPLSRDEIAALSLKGPNASSPGGHGLFGSDARRLLDSHELLRAERDELAARVKTLEAALRGCTEATFGPDLIWAVEGARQILTGAESALTNAQIIGDGIALGIETCPRCVRAFIVARGPGHWTDPLVCCGADRSPPSLRQLSANSNLGKIRHIMAVRAEELDRVIALLREKANEVAQFGGEEGPTGALWYDRAASFLEFAGTDRRK